MPDKFMFSNGEYVATIVSIGDDKMTHMPKDSDTVVPIYPATTQRVLFSVFIPDEIRAKKPKAHQNRIKFASYGFQATPSYIKEKGLVVGANIDVKALYILGAVEGSYNYQRNRLNNPTFELGGLTIKVLKSEKPVAVPVGVAADIDFDLA